MYPDWPRSAKDLVPLPRCEGPKLKPFDFQGRQRIQFLGYLGQGSHAHVFKVKIRRQIYALKLFRFVYPYDWAHLSDDEYTFDPEILSACYDYSEPFNRECRAFGRIQESGHDDLALQCFGYLLLDEAHERTLMERFDEHLSGGFDGNGDEAGLDEVRSRYPGKDGRYPPIRGIVKAFGQTEEHLHTKDARRVLHETMMLQQLGIIHIDVAHRQLVGGKIADFSTAVTVPHYLTTPELNPRLTAEQKTFLKLETMNYSMADYWDFDDMINSWNREVKDKKDEIPVFAFTKGFGCQGKHLLRSAWTYVDPRRYDWKTPTTAPAVTRSQRTRPFLHRLAKGAVSKTQLKAKPPTLSYNGPGVKSLRQAPCLSNFLEWRVYDGLMFPQFRT